MAAPKKAASPSSDTSSVVMRDATAEIDDRRLPLVDRLRPAFLLAYNPVGWAPSDIDGRPVWLPEIVEIPIVPGTNGAFVKLRENDSADSIRSMIAYLRDERGMYPLDQRLQVPAGVLPPGVPGGGWSRAVDCRIRQSGDRLVTYVTPWHIAQPARQGQPITFRLHRPSWDLFRRWLVDAGHIVADGTLEAVQAEHRRRAADRLKLIEARPYPTSELAAKRVGEARANVERIDAATVPGGA